MISNNNNTNDSVKEIRAREKQTKEAELRTKCEALAVERFGEDELKKLSNANKGIWYLPVMDGDTGEIQKMALMKPITRNVLNYASTKITDEGLYAFLEACMRACFIEGDAEILEDDEYFIPAASSFNKIIESKTASLVKR